MQFSERLTANARTTLEARYLLRNEDGELVETPDQLVIRVSQAIARAEEPKSRAKYAKKFHRLISELRFIPNSPTLMNAGKKGGQLSACFVLPIEDHLEGIFDSLKAAALIHQSGGGTGFSFSQIRARGSKVKSTHGLAAGPIAFLRVFDAATESIKQGGARRGANMGILSVNHPDILEFIHCKSDLKSITNFNISVAADDRFFRELEGHHGATMQQKASAKFEQLVKSAWESGDPGLVFMERMNRFNPTPDAGEFAATNPCGEQPLLPYESCNLGSMNLAAYVSDGKFLENEFIADINDAVRFLDNVIDCNAYPVKECAKITKRNRKIGLGVMGYADALLLLKLKYGSTEAIAWGEKVMSLLDREAKCASMRLAKERGAFANWQKSTWKRWGYKPLRNATVSTVAPTGTISIIAGVSGGIEPIFSAEFVRNILDGMRVTDIPPVLERILADARMKVGERESVAVAVEKVLGEVWKPAHRVSIDEHILTQAAFQRHSDSSVSKTVNLPKTATTDDVKRAYLLAYRSGCKGITVYRDQSRPMQVLEKADCPEC